MFTKTKVIFICLTLSLPLIAFGGDAREALLAGLRKQMTGGPYRVKTMITSDKGSTEMNGEVVPPNQMHVAMNFGGQTTEMICVGDKHWMKIGGKWRASPVGIDMMSQIMPKVEELASKISKVEQAGEESLGGKLARVYTYHMELGEVAAGVKGDAKVWIDSASGVPVKLESNGEAMGIKNKTVQTIEYDFHHQNRSAGEMS
jgi:hypothetical protein